MRQLVFGTLFILLTTVGHSFSVTAQSSLSPKDTQEETALVRFPSQGPQVVKGLIVHLPKSPKHEISAVFQSAVNSGHVVVYKPSKKITSDCLKQECWEKVIQLSENKGSSEKDIDSKLNKILVTSWTPSKTDLKIGLPDKYKRVLLGSKWTASLFLNLNIKKGIKVIFESEVGVTTILITTR
jgi:hypothetical protein